MSLVIKNLGIQPYEKIWYEMQSFTDNRDENTADEIWLVQHPSVFTQGTAGKAEHLLIPSEIPVIHTDRGGQITYHGLGQQVMYVLLDIKRMKADGKEISVRDLVSALEKCVIKTLADYSIEGYPKPEAPGVYINGKKICSLGLRIRQGRSFHGLAFNVNMDLRPFLNINPCGYAGLEMAQLKDYISEQEATCEKVAPKLVRHFCEILGYNLQQIIYK